MAITPKDLQGKSTKDLYILFLSEEDRKKENIKTELPSFTRAEIQSLYDSLSLPRLLLLVSQISLGKTDYGLEKQSEELKKINEWINEIQQRITLAQEVKKGAKPNEKIDMNREGSSEERNKFNNCLREMLAWADEKNLTIGIDQPEGGGRPTLNPDPSDYIEQLQRISSTLNAEIKNITTNVSKYQSDSNTFTELMSAIVKKFTDLILGILNKTQ